MAQLAPMPELTKQLLKYGSLDIEKYLNETIPRYEHFLLETEKHNLQQVKNDIDAELFKSFLISSDSLLEVLNTYEEAHKIVNRMLDLSEEYKKLRLEAEVREEVVVNKEQVERFRQILADFSGDTEVFATDKRHLVHFDVLVEADGGEYVLVMTNDLLLIGKKEPGTSKYRLVNAYSYSILQMSIDKNDVLEVKLEPKTFRFRKDRESIDRILETFREMTYEYREESERTESEPEDNGELDEFLACTEQYSAIASNASSMVPDLYDRRGLVEYLRKMASFDRDISDRLFAFLEKRFSIAISRINRVKRLDDLISDVFEHFMRFFSEQDRLIEELRSIGRIRRSGVVLLLEREILLCFKMLEGRVFNREYQIKCMDSSLQLIEEKLRFRNCDFSYLMRYFFEKKEKYGGRCVESAKRDIERILKSLYLNKA
jgi:hypothetical protein